MQTSYPKDKIKFLLLESIHDHGVDRLRDEGFDVQTETRALPEDELVERLADVHVLGIRSKTRLTERALEAAPRLLAAGCFCIGTNQVNLAHAKALGVPVFNSPFSNTRSVAELTIAEIIALHRRLTDRSRQLHEGVWRKSAAGAHEIRGRTLGIVGYGHIGAQVSVLAEAMGMRVLFHDQVSKLPLGNAEPVDTLGELLERSDVVTLHVPETEQTKGMIGAAELARMRPDAMLINNARGSIVDLAALAESVRTKALGGAALDVFPAEPASGAEPFASEVQGLDNVILTPHIGGSTLEAQANIAGDVAGKLIRFVNNGSTTGSVNLPQVELPEQPPQQRDGGARRHRILHLHRNVPGVLSKIHAALGSAGVNVSGEYLRTDESVGYVVLDIDPTGDQAAVESLRSIPETIRTRVLW